MTTLRNKMAVAAVALVTGLAIGAVQAHEVKPGSSGDVQGRFDRMESMMKEAPQLRGDRRRRVLDDHMRLMHEQIEAMHGMQGGHGGMMMGSGMTRGGGGGSTQTTPRAGADDVRTQMGAMQQRMDAMQRMMEQMLHQQELMLDDEDG
jgi:hypothetical protein